MNGTTEHGLDLILTLTVGLSAALILGFVTQRLRLSPIVGYLLAGVVIGPFTPGLHADVGIAQQFAELGVILLMFGIGLQLHVEELLAVRRVAIPGALGAMALATALGVGVVVLVEGWTPLAGIVYGLSISIASTVVVLRILADREALHTPTGHIAIGWLLVEDLVTVLVLVMLPVVVGQSAATGVGQMVASVGLAILKIAALLAFTALVGRRVIPKLLGYAAAVRSRELFTLTVLVLALGVAVGSSRFFGVSMALGAFIAGLVVGQSVFSTRAASEALPMRDAFAVLFFVSMGMLLDPAQIVPNAGLIAATLAVILLGKPLVAGLIIHQRRYPLKTALAVAVSLAQIGEFSLILGGLGRQLDVLPAKALQVLVTASIVSITLNPLVFKLVDPIARWASRRVPAAALGDPSLPAEQGNRAVVIGYGPVGRTLARLLHENGIQPVIVELNHETVDRLRAEGVHAIYGDASQREVLEQAGVRHAGSLVFAASGSPEAVVRQATALNPKVLILTRATYLREVAALKQAGVQVVVSAEAEIALAMTEHLLRQLGATADQLDRARDRVRSELSG